MSLLRRCGILPLHVPPQHAGHTMAPQAEEPRCGHGWGRLYACACLGGEVRSGDAWQVG